MKRLPLLLFSLIPLFSSRAQAGDEASLQQALALQKVMQKAIRDAEPSIACILVSRSDGYKRVDQAPPNPERGRLGGFIAQTEEQKRLDLSDPTHVPESFGSGVVIDPSGLILTHYHVVRDATKIFVRLPGKRESYADIHAADPRSDLAVLRLITQGFDLQPIKLGDGGELERGQFILSIANPFAAGFRDGQPSASWGIISNLRRRPPTGQTREDDRAKTLHQWGTLIQTDARLTMGCSGGALLNLQGEMVGLTSSLAGIHGGETPGGFAVPIDAGMKRIVEVLKRGEEVDYGFLGVTLNKHHSGPGASVESALIGSPAEAQAGLRANEVILKVGDVPIQDNDDLMLALGKHLAGERVKLEIRRWSGETATAKVTLVKYHLPFKSIASSLGNRPWVRGLRVDYTSLAAQQVMQWRNKARIAPGVMVTEIEPKSPAEAARLGINDVITHVNGQPVHDPASFYREFAKHRGPISLTVGGFGFGRIPHTVTIN